MKLLIFWLALALTALSLGVFAQTPPALSGAWVGTLKTGGPELPLVVHFAPKPDGTLTATFDSPNQGAVGLPFSAAKVTGQSVHLEAASIGGSFDGTLDASGKTLAGNWKQGGASLPLTLTKTDKVTAKVMPLDRPQEPKPPFPYTARDVLFPGGAAGVTLAGTLTVPAGAGPFPAVVLISGSGPNSRNEAVFGHKPFLLLADTLTRRGVAVLRYDKRGVGQSTGSYALATTLDFAADAQAAVAYLKTQTEIAPKKIGLLGHSEGGLIAPMVASQHPSEIAFIVLLAGPGVVGEKLLLAQSALLSKADGATPAQVAQSRALDEALFSIAARDTNPAARDAAVQAAVLKAVASLSPADKAQIGDPLSYAKMQSKILASPWMRFFLTYDPKQALEKTRCPVLALGGSEDLQVPATENLAAIASALKGGGNKNVTIQELPNVNHLFQTCVTGSPSEYAKISQTMSPGALTLIGDWVIKQSH